MLAAYLVDIITLLVAAVIAVPLFKILRLGLVPGLLIAGVVVGPSGLGLVGNVGEISSLAEIGVVLLLFVVGMELRPSRFWLMRRWVFGMGTVQVLITAMAIASLVYLFADLPLAVVVLIGPALALSSTAFVLQLLTEQRALTSLFGRACLAVLLLQDLAVVPLLALVPLLAMSEMSLGSNVGMALVQSVAIIALVIVGGRYLLQPVLHRIALTGSSEAFTITAILLVLGTALITEHAGLSMAMGAFLAGLLISDSPYRHQVMAEINPFRGLFLGLFFMSMGMSLNLDYFLAYPLLSIALAVLLIVLKAVMLWPIAWVFGLKGKSGLAVALALAQSGEFALVLFALARQENLIDEPLFQQLLVVVLLTMLTTTALVSVARKLATEKKTQEGEREAPELAPIVIAGFGRVGRRIGDLLKLADQPFVALDINAERVEAQRGDYPVYYGDVRQTEVLRAAGASQARFIIVTLNDVEATKEVVTALRHAHPDVDIFVRGHGLYECQKLRKLGASAAVPENLEASVALAGLVMTEAGVSEQRRDVIIDDFRRSYYAQIEEGDGTAG